MNKSVLALLSVLPLLGACQTTSLDPGQTSQISSLDFQGMVKTTCGVVISVQAASALLSTLDPRVETATQLLASLCQVLQPRSMVRSGPRTETVFFRGVTIRARRS